MKRYKCSCGIRSEEIAEENTYADNLARSFEQSIRRLTNPWRNHLGAQGMEGRCDKEKWSERCTTVDSSFVNGAESNEKRREVCQLQQNFENAL